MGNDSEHQYVITSALYNVKFDVMMLYNMLCSK